MTHDEIRELIDAYADDELDLVSSREVERHLQSCDDCRSAKQNVQVVRDALRESGAAYKAPAGLRRKIRRALRSEDKSLSPFRWLLVPAACALVLLAGWQVWQTTRSAGDAVANEVVASHVRSLLATHLVDVTSSDQHTVKPWFDGKIDFAPQVNDLSAHGFPLLGGRLDYFNGAPAAALVYQHNKHPINLFIQPAPGHEDKAPSTHTVRGYNLIRWSRDGLNYWAISDLNATELNDFVALTIH
jgi:anti-sigma factor RsiW